ncbi:MAG: hypothetical protein ACYC2T_14900 [Bacillota bacterium]
MLVLQGRHGKIIIDEPVIKEPTREDIEGVYRVLVECLINQAIREQGQGTGGEEEPLGDGLEPDQYMANRVPYE